MLLLFVFACSDHRLGKQQEVNSGAYPKLVVSPQEIDFGIFDSTTIFREITIENQGDGRLQVEPLNIRSDLGLSFFFPNPSQSIELQSGEKQTVLVGFEGEEAYSNAWVQVNSNDVETGLVEVHLYGQALVPKLEVIPNPLDFGEIQVGCHDAQQLILSNAGEVPLTLYSITGEQNTSFAFEDTQEYPFTFLPSDFHIVPVSFSPTELGYMEYELTVLSDEPNQVQSVLLSGTGIAEEKEDVWEIEEAPKSDILFSVDLSSSMSDEAQTLGQQFSTFITELSTYTSDWHVMVVNADHGCNHSGILTPSTVGYETIFSDAVRTGAYDISFTEALLTNVTHGVEKTGPSDCNAGFLRPDAMLHIIMLSDECEQSPNPGICGTQWQTYIDRVVAIKGDANMVRMSAVAGDYPSGCGNPQTAEFGSGYWEATQITGGTFLSICSDWTSPLALQQLATTSISQSRFSLSALPIVDSIEVLVDGSVHSDWTFDESNNEVVFTASFPNSGTTVRIQYHEQADCEQ